MSVPSWFRAINKLEIFQDEDGEKYSDSVLLITTADSGDTIEDSAFAYVGHPKYIYHKIELIELPENLASLSKEEKLELRIRNAKKLGMEFCSSLYPDKDKGLCYCPIMEVCSAEELKKLLAADKK